MLSAMEMSSKMTTEKNILWPQLQKEFIWQTQGELFLQIDRAGIQIEES